MNEPDSKKDKSDDRLSAHARQLFNDSVERLDAETLSQLNRRRQRALGSTNRGGPYIQWLRLTSVATVAAAAAMAVIVWSLDGGVDELPPETASDFEILLAEEDLEMFEGLEFYRWMALEETAPEPEPDDHVG